MSFSHLVGIVLEILVAGMAGILLDRALGTTVLAVWLIMCLLGLGWLHRREIRPLFHTSKPSQSIAVPASSPSAQPTPATNPTTPPTVTVQPSPTPLSSSEKLRPEKATPPLTRHVEHPSGFLILDKPVVTNEYNMIAPNKQFGMNLRSLNASTERVFRAFAFTAGYILPAADTSDTEAAMRLAKQVKTLRQPYVSGTIKGPEIAAGTPGIWGTLLLHESGGLTEDEANGIVSRRLRIYYVTWLVWTDLQGRMDWTDDCRWLQIPEQPLPSSNDLVWHFCEAELP